MFVQTFFLFTFVNIFGTKKEYVNAKNKLPFIYSIDHFRDSFRKIKHFITSTLCIFHPFYTTVVCVMDRYRTI